jgi:hypothetical protein
MTMSRIPSRRRRALEIVYLVLAAVALAFSIVMLAAYFQLSQAHEHNHPPADAAIHEKFYSTWMMPDDPKRSCCNRQDCYPTEARYRHWFWEAEGEGGREAAKMRNRREPPAEVVGH